MSKEAQLALQLIYDPFYDSGGTWPTLKQLQRALSRRIGHDVDAFQIVQRIPATLLKPLNSPNGYLAMNERLILTLEGIALCAGSHEDVANALMAVKCLGGLADRSDLANGQREWGLRFTTRRLAKALSLDSDPNAVRRLVAILQSEGWVQDNGGIQGKPRKSALRTPGNPSVSRGRWDLGLSEDQASAAAHA